MLLKTIPVSVLPSQPIGQMIGRFLATMVCLVLLGMGAAGWAFAQDENPDSQLETTPPPEEIVDSAPEFAWEYKPYRVKIWVCTDRSAEIIANIDRLMSGIMTRFELIDPSCLRLEIKEAKTAWRHAFLEQIEETTSLGEVLNDPDLEGFDKLMVVCLDNREGTIRSRVRELDIQTQQWGPLNIDTITQTSQLVQVVTNAIARAFMPIARVERITDKDEVFTRARAMKSCIIVRQDESLEFISEPNTDSPVWVQPDDRFLPVIRRTDRSGNLRRLETIDFTFLTIDDQFETEAKCSIQSYHRAPLAGRANRRTQKLALVIRPPHQPTTLTLVSRDDEARPMEGVEIWSRGPDEPKNASVQIGKTDWKGRFVIEPNEDGMRIILLKRGSHGLMRLPIIPGLYPNLEATVPNDEARLFAEGVISGLNNEILNLVAQRSLFEAEIEAAIEKKEGMVAREVLIKYQELPSTQQLKIRLGNEEAQLKSRTDNQRELDYIAKMFETLKIILNSQAATSKESHLREEIQKLPFSAEKPNQR